ncbi:hypothetical protein QBC38DRAFT_531785 [Podospora fimiseda]|uniref:ATP-dependent DNA ligase family profile domain-containing protein n=1 Tax=Podospora fimiseda TaxID=252190 RepID=A0AAN7H0I7_9PEZI|nr:hypothetical protein QBC38DRAFT_531785 [Podospora fimiseda]
MPLSFSSICDLLQRLEDNRLARKGVTTSSIIIQEWFGKNQTELQRNETRTAAILSTLFPEKRTDRVYNIREKKLQSLIARGLCLGRSRIAQLGRWSLHGTGVDLAECVEGIVKETPNPNDHTAVAVDEVDDLLHRLAASCRFSSPAVQQSSSGARLADHELHLGELYRRVSARDAKWLTRLILKNYEPVVLDPHIVYRNLHPLLPAILKVQDDFTVAGHVLDTQRRNRTVTGRNDLAEFLKPSLGVKVGRQTWLKGRSIKHVLSMCYGRISCEEKLDGEYCQIHIDLTKGENCIQIFSKSGKDSTADRIKLHESIRKSLRIGEAQCRFKRGCILEGELVVWSDREEKILDFHKIRKHVSRSGSFIGTAMDSQTHHWEHLMIVYFDVLMIDDESLLSVKHSERFQRLKQLVTLVPGRSDLVKRVTIDFNSRMAVSDLRRLFAKCITAQQEGLVIKADDPYFDFNTSKRPYCCCAIKLKKEYVGNFGDIGDFAVVGARFDATKAKSYNIPTLKWTHFYIGCLENKEEVRRFGKRPKFIVTNAVTLNASQLETFALFVNPETTLLDENTAFDLRIEPGVDEGRRPTVVFPSPPVFDLRCFSFDKEGNTGFWTPRFPMVNKVHCDRTYHDAISFSELQEMAIQEKEAPPPDDSQELLGWIAALEKADPKTAIDTDTQSTAATTTAPPTPSQRASTSQVSDSQGETQVSVNTVWRQLTHPLSSFIEASVLRLSQPISHSPREEDSRGRKRSSDSLVTEGITSSSKVRKRSPDQTASSAFSSQQNNGTVSCNGYRVPLRDVSAGSSRRNHEPDHPRPGLSASFSMYQPLLEDNLSNPGQTAPPSLMASMSFHKITAPVSSGSSFKGLTDRPTASFSTHLSSCRSQGNCKYYPDECVLSAYSILLSPCIAGFPWVTEDLLSAHGVTGFIKDPLEWNAAQFISSNNSCTPSSSDATTQQSSGRRKRKVIFVDIRRKKATEEFLQQVEAANITRSNGDREYVPVYDWRVLEVLKEEERKSKGNRGKYEALFKMNGVNIFWKRFWVGLA